MDTAGNLFLGSSRCGGSLVNEWYVVTAGHCVAKARVHQIRITLGEYILKSGAEPLPGRTYGASAIKVHPYFKFTPQADRYDVAVVRLNRRVDFAPHISPICLPPKHTDLMGRRALVSGWGALNPGSRLRPKTLQVRRKTFQTHFFLPHDFWFNGPPDGPFKKDHNMKIIFLQNKLGPSKSIEI